MADSTTPSSSTSSSSGTSSDTGTTDTGSSTSTTDKSTTATDSGTTTDTDTPSVGDETPAGPGTLTQPEEASEPSDVNLYLAADGLTGRDGGPYLDQEERRLAEKRRAFVEDREPDYDHPAATAGTVLVNASQLVDTASVNQPSNSGDKKTEADNKAVDQIVASDESNLEVFTTVPKEVFQPVPESRSAE
jgi:hypothetical protein